MEPAGRLLAQIAASDLAAVCDALERLMAVVVADIACMERKEGQ
jgi:hypothetical protein